MTLVEIYILCGAVVLLVAAFVAWIALTRKTAEQRELMRRRAIELHGRISDGTVLDARELVLGTQPAQFIYYTYEVAGVQYECSQEITHLTQYVDVHSCGVGGAASVKYDARHPGNSIVISEHWCGLRK